MSPVPEPTLRRAGPHDAALVRQLVREAYAKWVPVLGREPLPMQADYDYAVRHHEIDLLVDGPTIVALIETIPHSDHLFIENIAVAPDQQGRGLGSALLDHAEQRARTLALPMLRLLTSQAFASNIRLYLSRGFTIDRTEPFRGGTTVYMRKAVAAAD